jgi:hypothetical protein
LSSDAARDLELIFEGYRADKRNIRKADLGDIRRYELEWRRYHIRVKKAIREATSEINALPSFNEDMLNEYLQGYHRREASSYRHREQNYEITPDLLDRLTEVRSRSEFMQIYEQLVGKSGQSALWYSGSLYRNKHAVADEFAEACKMVQAIAENPDASPSELFELGLPYVKRVHRLGVNILTEVMHSYYPNRCPVLNNNSLGSLHRLAMAQFPNPQAFKPEDYHRFTETIDYLRNRCGFQSMGQVDHFLNHVYHNYVKSSSRTQE